MLRTTLLALAAAAGLVNAAPVERAADLSISPIEERGGAWTLSADVVAAWQPLAHYAA